MTPWWSEQAGAWIGGVGGGGLGALGGLYGAMVGVLAPRGRGRTMVMAMHVLLLGLGVASLLLGIAALVAGQPYHVWYPLGLIGFIMSIVMGSLLPVVRMQYRRAEERRIDAAAIRRG